MALEIEANRETGQVRVVRAVSAVDAGQVVSPDGIRNQIEGAIVQATNWTMYESVTFDSTRSRQSIGRPIRSCALIASRTPLTCISLTGQVNHSWALERQGRAQQQLQSQTPSQTQPDSASAICHSLQ